MPMIVFTFNHPIFETYKTYYTYKYWNTRHIDFFKWLTLLQNYDSIILIANCRTK